jgi:hypothetical protein
VRDADAPGFYDDVSRYWSSLNDVTGRDALFAVAGVDASKHLPSTPELEDRSWTGFSTLIASPTGTTEIKRLRRDAASARAGLRRDSSLFRANTRRPAHAEIIAEANTGQVSALARRLGVGEGDIPCLHLTLIRSATTDTTVVPISVLGDFSIYAACKEIMRRLQPVLVAWSAAQSWHAAPELLRRNGVLTGAEAKVTAAEAKVMALEGAEYSARFAADRRKRAAHFAAQGLLAASDKVQNLLIVASVGQQEKINLLVAKCNNSQRKETEKAELLRDIQQCKTTQLLTGPQAKALRALAACAYSSSLLEPTNQHPEVQEIQDRTASATREKTKALEEAAIARAAVEERQTALRRIAWDVEDHAAQGFKGLGTSFSTNPMEKQWDCFISYPKPEQSLAIRVFERLQTLGRPFLDHYCLCLGEDWTSRLGAVQAGCQVTIALISQHTARAHFQLSEIHRAINLMRRGNHRVLPVYTSKRASTPLGLEQIHSVFPTSDEPEELVTAVKDAIIAALAEDRLMPG